ncbi:hypothetical protein [Salinimonas chungwhensis]|uniref:hypothetical protein n=1 Tax=Salinimonas chungwhensis TaxID=265425 RepID=UPI0012EA26BC|nr:hypothetical protein [Salinimonas chungwhensis]
MNKIITTQFNIIATLALIFVEILHTAVTHESGSSSGDTLMATYVSSDLSLLFILINIGLLSALIMSGLFKHVWNALISDIFNLREIVFNEAYAVCIIVSWVLWG